jgi:hypothetical protein
VFQKWCTAEVAKVRYMRDPSLSWNRVLRGKSTVGLIFNIFSPCIQIAYQLLFLQYLDIGPCFEPDKSGVLYLVYFRFILILSINCTWVFERFLPSSCLSICLLSRLPACVIASTTGRIFMKFGAGNFWNAVDKFRILLKSDKYRALYMNASLRFITVGDTFAIQAVLDNINIFVVSDM